MTDDSRGSTIIVIPAFNEADSLPAVLLELKAVLPDLDIVVVDDGSTDSTPEAARSFGAVCVSLPFNLGIGGALRTGYRFAHEAGYERAVQFDADGQHRADQVLSLLAALDQGAHMAVGTRFAGLGNYEVGFGRRLAMRSLRVGVRVLCGRWFSDTSSGFRAVGPDLLRVFATEYPVDYMDSVETLVAASRAGYVITEVPVTMRQRAAGVASQRSLRLAYHYARLIVALVGSSRRAFPPPADSRQP